MMMMKCKAYTEFRFPSCGFRSHTVVPSASTYQLRPAAVTRLSNAKNATESDTAGVVVHDITPYVVYSELLMYVNCFRDTAEVENVKKVLASFCSSNEITEAKKLLLTINAEVLSSERRSSTQRQASEAE